MSNLIKSYYVNTAEQKDSRIIDSNAMMDRKMEILRELFPQTGFGGEDGENEDTDGTGSDEFTEGLDPEQVAKLLDEDGGSGPVRKALSPQEEAKAEADRILEEARTEAEEIVRKAQDDAAGKAEGIEKNAREEGYQAGYDEGIRMAQTKEAEIRAEAEDLLARGQELKSSYEEFLKDAEPRLVDSLIRIYENVIHMNLGAHREELLYLIDHVMRADEDSRHFVVHVSGEALADVKAGKEMLKENLPENATIDIIEDLTLTGNACIIDADGSIFDCGLDTQLEELGKKLRTLSYDGN